jgi:hypothetical protein
VDNEPKQIHPPVPQSTAWLSKVGLLIATIGCNSTAWERFLYRQL